MTAAAPPRNRITGADLRELLRLIADGNANARIARRLGVTEDTVKRRAKRLYADLGAVDRAHAVAIGYQRGLLAVPPPVAGGGQLAALSVWCRDRAGECLSPEARAALSSVVDEIRRRLAETRSGGAS